MLCLQVKLPSLMPPLLRKVFACLATLGGGLVVSSNLAAAHPGHDLLFDKPSPHYVLRLNLNEFSILNVSEMDGLLKYGGSGDLRLRMAKEENSVVWTLTIESPRLMEL